MSRSPQYTSENPLSFRLGGPYPQYNEYYTINGRLFKEPPQNNTFIYMAPERIAYLKSTYPSLGEALATRDPLQYLHNKQMEITNSIAAYKNIFGTY
jgi:hypothetical protein